ncbi:G-type lectin S-receptor-like serine/threonine-protein kinase LECRK3 [Neltuma alba]|uniref:G-type lectin S-receptor-like serine/threonine-protein kinase LECRK3 n=1 Tax=Neltuma alba TaxID=207710 RepID=UPI0010A3A472|nr:G-type lectin S-receptor-like serine/threonine-protein kinase LECRK3 [Prosopis alba]
MAFRFLPLVLFIFILLPFNALAQTKSTVAVGDSLSAGNGYSTWLLSPSGDFSFGFHPLDINNNDLFLLSIWYAKIPDKTIVWYANGNKPAPKGSKVQLTSDRGFVLTSPNGTDLWKSQVIDVSGVALAALNDTGNLVLQDPKFKVVWETFKDPRDSLLPTQILEKGGKLFSRTFEANFSTGRYQIFLQQDGNLVFYSVNLPSGYANENYFESGTVVSNSSSAGHLLVFDPSGDLYVLKDDNERFSLSPSGKTPSNDISTGFYLRATLNFDGVFSLYKYPKNKNSSDQKQSWIPVWSQPENICTSSLASAGSGVCGYNSICDLNDAQRPICQCPQGYSLIDPNDAYGSCKPDFTQGCEEDRRLHDFQVLINTDWPLSDYVLQRPFTEEECKQSCLEDCFCSVAIFRLGDSCWKKKLPLSNGRVDANLNNSKAFIKVKKNN